MSNTSDLFPDQVIPVPIPGTTDLNSFYDNTSRSVPQAPSPEIRAYWSGSPTPIRFTFLPLGVANPLNAQVYQAAPPAGLLQTTARALWKSPIFDLRPDLKASGSYQPEARPIMRGADFGRGARLILRSSGLTQIPVGFKVYSVEFGSTNNPRQMFAMNARQDITSHFFDPWPAQQGGPPQAPGLQNFGTGASLLGWEPAANPIRFWSVAVIFELTQGNPPLDLVCQGEVL